MNLLNRRQLLGMGGMFALGGVAGQLPAAAVAEAGSGFRLFDARAFGAVGDGRKLDTDAINRAIDACNGAGGGWVYVSPGTYLCGTVVLKSNVTLYLEAGATLLGSKSLSDYTAQPMRPPKQGDDRKPAVFGRDASDTSPFHLIFARDADNVRILGPGRIDGQGSAYWEPSGKSPLPPDETWKEVATHAWKAGERPSPMLEFYRCTNLRIEDVRIENASGWTLRPVECTDVFIHGIRIKNPIFGINTDGIDLIGCRNVFISDCLIDTGDDAICLKSESPYGGEVRDSKNITITNCVLTCCCNGLKVGTATYGRMENISFSNSVIFNDNVPLKERVISGIALEMVDGGALEGVMISNIRMQRVRTPIFIRCGNRHSRANGVAGTLRGVMIENVQATGSILTSSITGVPGFDVEDVTLSGLRIDSDEGGKAEWVSRPIPEEIKSYPEARMFGRLPGYGLYCRHVKGLRLRQIEFRAAAAEARPAIVCDEVTDVEISELRCAPIVGSQPTIKLVQTRQAFIHGCMAAIDSKFFLEVQGEQTAGVLLMNNHLNGAEQAVQSGPEVSQRAIVMAGNLGGKA